MPSNIKTVKEEKGITGLETAIILIAFVIVASVLSYVAISAGLFSSQKAKIAVNAGLEQTGSTMELKSDVVAVMDKATNKVTSVYFTVGLVPGGNSIDLTDNPSTTGGATPTDNQTSTLVISYSDANEHVDSLYWTVKFINNNNGDQMLDPGELALITVDLNTTDYPDDMTTGAIAGSTINLTVIPPDGAVLPIERTIPYGINFASGSTGDYMINLH